MDKLNRQLILFNQNQLMAGEMTQMVKPLTCKPENWSLIPKTYEKG